MSAKRSATASSTRQSLSRNDNNSNSVSNGRNSGHVKMYVKLLTTGEKFPLKFVTLDMKIGELKNYIEYAAGIPKHLQRLTYLDEAEMLDDSDIRSHDIVPGGTICLKVWNTWTSLVTSVANNDVENLFQLGVSPGAVYHTPSSDYMSKKNRDSLLKERAFTSLFLAAHRGNKRMCENIVDAGADINATTGLGRSALHVAASQGHGNIVDSLLDKGADIDALDKFGDNALSVAAKFGQKDCERHLFLWRWQQRANAVTAKPKSQETDLMAHQFFDSAFPVWLNGSSAQIYFANVLSTQEFEGTALEAKKSVKVLPANYDDDSEEEDEFENVYETYGTEEDREKRKEALQSRKSQRSTGSKLNRLETIEERETPQNSAPSRAQQRSSEVAAGRVSIPSYVLEPTTPRFFQRSLSSHSKQNPKLSSRNKKRGRICSYRRHSFHPDFMVLSNDILSVPMFASLNIPSRYVLRKVKKKTKAESFQDWLDKKKATEEVCVAKMKKEQQEKKWAADKKKLDSEVGKQSYDVWVKEQEIKKKKEQLKNTGGPKTENVTKFDKKEKYRKEVDDPLPDINELKNMFSSKLKTNSQTEFVDLKEKAGVLDKIRTGKHYLSATKV